MIPTGFQKLDRILGGGARPNCITDIFGASGTGKTQLVEQLAINCLVQNGSVFFVDTTGRLQIERVAQMLRESNKDLSLLDKLEIFRATTTYEQTKALDMAEENNADLLIVDDVSDLYSFEYGREGQSMDKNLRFMKYMKKLSALAISNRIPVVITNMIRQFDGVERENLQSAIRQFVHVRIHLSHTGNGYFGDVFLPMITSRFTYTINSCGLCDV